MYLYSLLWGALPHPTSFIKRDLLTRLGGYNESYRIMSDWCFLEAVVVQNCSYRTLNVLLSKFNCFGISSTSSATETEKTWECIRNRFPRIMEDYIPYEDEAVYNVLLWTHEKTFLRKLMLFPFKLINQCLKLRNRLGKRIGVYPINKK